MANEKKDNGIGVFVPVEVSEDKTFWNRIGAGFVNSKGLTLLLDAIPAGGRAVVISDELDPGEGPYRVFTVNEYEKDGERRSRWTRIGTALPNKKGLTVLFNGYPTNGKAIVLMVEDARGQAGDAPF
jgi:hypothetical protein